MRVGAVKYEKYENMSRKKLLGSLVDAQMKEKRLKQEYQNNLQNIKELIRFLRLKLGNGMEAAKILENQAFTPLSESEIFNEFYNSITPEEHQKIAEEIQQDMEEFIK